MPAFSPFLPKVISRFLFLTAFLCLAGGLNWNHSSLLARDANPQPSTENNAPNIVVIFADDLGYADVGCFGAKKWKTPNLDKLASEGVRFTDFHSSQPVCSASRASLLTGCYANRIGIHGALFPQSKIGINPQEVTIAEMLKAKGYATGMVGKWHLGHRPESLPLQHGFDMYLGLPYSNDMWPHGRVARPTDYPTLPLFDGNEVADADVTAEDQATLTAKYRERSLKFIRDNSDKPFFLYFAHTFPHVPLFVGKSFRGKSEGGVYGDVIEEFDAAIGDILSAIDEAGIKDNTLVLFTSDNGPWLTYGNHGGSALPLREGKGTSFEGGIRVPMIARWPKMIPANSICKEPSMTIDVFPTIASIVGAELPNHKIDGRNLVAFFEKPNSPGGTADNAPVYLHYYRTNELQAVRWGDWKLYLPHTADVTKGGEIGGDGKPGRLVKLAIQSPELYNLKVDISETKDVANENQEVVTKMLQLAERAREELGDSLTKRKGSGNREPMRFE